MDITGCSPRFPQVFEGKGIFDGMNWLTYYVFLVRVGTVNWQMMADALTEHGIAWLNGSISA